jgi:HTH-type transcriptional regulator/antitoxin MqsA
MTASKRAARDGEQSCPECGGRMRYREGADVVRYKDHERSIQTTAWWCRSCGEAILAGGDLRAREKAFMALKAEVDGTLTPEEVARIRRKLGVSQREAGKLLGGGPRAFQKYESGAAAVSAPMSNLLRLLAEDPSRLEELRARRDS